MLSETVSNKSPCRIEFTAEQSFMSRLPGRTVDCDDAGSNVYDRGEPRASRSNLRAKRRRLTSERSLFIVIERARGPSSGAAQFTTPLRSPAQTNTESTIYSYIMYRTIHNVCCVRCSRTLEEKCSLKR